MFIRIEKASAVPISRQIADQVRALCVAKTLGPGEKVPSVRFLARDLAVNQNTILRVYERLTDEGWLEMRHGDGTYVSADPPTWRREEQIREIGDELSRIVRRASMLGLETARLREIFNGAVRESHEIAARRPPEDGTT